MKRLASLGLLVLLVQCDSSRPVTVGGGGDDCNDRAAAPTCECVIGSAPLPCGQGGACERPCGSDGKLGTCLPPGATAVDLTADIANCGECGNACPTPANAQATCIAGVCGRSPCAKGHFALDADRVNGCESSCTGSACTGPAGSFTLASPPLPEPVALKGNASAASWGANLQTSAQHTHFGIIAESTPAPLDEIESKSSKYRHVGGLIADKRP